MISFLNIYISLLALGREAASIQLQDALDRASSSETRARDAEERLVTEQARYHALEEQLNASQTRATDAEAQSRDARSQLDLQTQGTFPILPSIDWLTKQLPTNSRLILVMIVLVCDQYLSYLQLQLMSTPINSNKPARTELEHRLTRIEQALHRARDEIFEQRFMSAACRRSDEFQVSRVLGRGDNGMVAQVKCTTPGFLWNDKPYALKVCFNFDLDTNQARNAYLNEFIELVKLPSHPNIVRFLCEFVDEIHDNIRPHLPDAARENSTITHRDGTQTNRKTQFFVLEFVEVSLSRLLESRFAPPSIVPHRMVATIISQVGSGLRHLDRHRLAHRDIKTDNIMVETRLVDATTNEIEITRCVT